MRTTSRITWQYSSLILSAIVAVTVGASIYIFGRDWAHVQFLEPFTAWQPALNVTLGPIANSLPSLAHAYAFSILIILALWPARQARRTGAIAWLLLAVVLECLQSGPVQNVIADSTANFGRLPLGKNLVAYILNGRFDAMDILAATVGVAIAYGMSSVLEKQR